MEAKYFMVGDYVLNNEGIAFRVAQVNDACYGEHTSDLMLENGEEYKEVDAIEITAEILEKNGFDIAILNNKEPEAYLRMGYLDDDGEMEDVAYDIIIDHHKTYWELTIINNDKGCRIDININYVHELQHALRLCGIDKEIVL